MRSVCIDFVNFEFRDVSQTCVGPVSGGAITVNNQGVAKTLGFLDDYFPPARRSRP